MVILAAEDLAVQSTYHRNKKGIQVQLVFGQDMILPINNIENWRYIHQQKQTQIEKDVIRENSTRTDYYYNIGDKVLVRRNQAYK